jgi:uncharacterized protein YrzB (UPF0473 family)
MNDKEHGCNCGHDHDHNQEDIDIIYLTLDDDTELECEVLGIFEVEDKEYIALLPLNEEDADVLLYQYEEISDEEFNLAQIEDDEEFDLVSEAFNALFMEDDYDYEDYDEEEEE